MLKLQIIGHIGQDATAKQIAGTETTVINFSVCHTERQKMPDGSKKETSYWVTCSIFKKKGDSIEITKYLTKGTQVFCEGLPRPNAYLNSAQQPTGEIKLRVDKVELLSAAKPTYDQGATAPQSSAQPMSRATAMTDDDDLPF